MSACRRREYLGNSYDRYQSAHQRFKHQVWDELEVTDSNRMYAVRLLSGPYPPVVRKRSGRLPRYGRDVIEGLAAI